MTTGTEEVAEAGARERGTQFRRALLKLSGEALLGGREYGIDPKTVSAIAVTVVGSIPYSRPPRSASPESLSSARRKRVPDPIASACAT